MKKNRITILFVIFYLFYATGIDAQDKTSKKEKTKKDEKKATVEEKTKSCKKIPGLFTLFQDTTSGSVYILVKKEQLGKEFIYQSFSMGGPPQLFLNQNMIRSNFIFSLKKSFNKIQWLTSNTNYYYDPENPISKSANVDFSKALFYSTEIIAENKDGMLIKVDDLLLSEKMDPVKPFVEPKTPPTAYLNLGKLSKDNSSYLHIKSYPKNTDVLVELAYENPNPVNFGGTEITDARFIQIKLQHSFIELPENDYVPRLDDYRVGYFIQQKDDMTTHKIPRYRDYINRWNLKKKDPNASLSEPVEPIVWWVENTTPPELRDIIVNAGLNWNKAFEKAGFKNAVVMKIMPDDADWDPSDIRYNVIRWVSSDLGYAIGPSFVNPRTGQILGADITIDFGLFRNFVSAAELFETFSSDNMHQNHMMCGLGKGLRMQYNAASAFVEAFDGSEKELATLTKQFVTFLVMHEMGHTMGLNHNMKASQMLSPKELQDKSITSKMGVTGSVMDYPATNVALDKANQADYYTTTVGPYDLWAIEFGYTPFDKANEQEGLAKILARSSEPQLIFGNDADITSPGRGIDPRVTTWDMSNDMISYAEDRFKLVNKTMPLLKDKFVNPESTYEKLVNKYLSLFGQRLGMARGVSHYIGGIYLERGAPGDNTVPFKPVPYDYQKKAMNLLNTYIFAPDAFNSDVQLYSYLQRQRRGFSFFSTTEDPKFDSYIFRLQSDVFDFIFHPVTLQRISNTTMYGNSYKVVDVMDDLSSSIFDADISTDVNLHRQKVQAELVKRLSQVMDNKKGEFDNAAVSAAYYTLIKIKDKLKKAKSASEQTKAHRSYLEYLIDTQLSIQGKSDK